MKRILFSSVLFLIAITIHAQAKWPAVTNTAKPWTRWWWEGSSVNEKDLQWNLEQYQKAGLGGTEITPIYGVYGHEKEFVNFLSPQWMKLFEYTLKESKKLGLGVDLANGTGWPFGGPWVADKDASKSIYYKSYSLKGGEELKEPVQYTREALVRTANNKPAGADTILRPLSANKNLQALALDQIQFAEQLPLQCLVAYSSDGKTMLDLTSKVDKKGKLNWKATGKSTWTLYALFEGLHGKMVERAAPGGEGYAIDHFSSNAAKNYFKKFDTAFRGYDISYLRAFFNDSYEVDDARGQANWTPNFLSEFKKRKGYDLKNHLPALFSKSDTFTNSRVVYDYRSVIDELLLEQFTIEWKKWGTGKGKMLRNQSHGSPANTLDLYSVVDIPETEGTDILRFKFATSAANVTGKKLVSAEACTWLNEHFLSSWADVKKSIDLYFLGGVNHIVYHGTAYSPQQAKWPGWLFYAAVHFQPTNPQWKDFATLNNYITRIQSFLQQGKPANDILLYYPIADRYSEPGPVLLQHFDGMERNFEKTDFEHVSKELLNKGYSFDFISDRQLLKTTVSGKQVISGGNQYKAILLPANKLVPDKTWQKLVELAKNGASIIFYKDLPADVPGLHNLEQRRKAFHDSFKELKWESTDTALANIQRKDEEERKETGALQDKVGKGFFYVGKEVDGLMREASAKAESMAEKDLQYIKRKNEKGYVYFISNRSDKAISDWIPLQVQAAGAVLFDPMTGTIGLSRTKKYIRPGPFEVYLQLQPFESIIVQTYTDNTTAENYPYTELMGYSRDITGEWTLEFLDGGPSIPAKRKISKLGSWTEIDSDTSLKNFSGTARYTITFPKHPENASAYIIDLGKVNETAEVFLNGKKITTLIGPTYRVKIPAEDFAESNTLEVIVANLMANRIIYMDRNNIPWKIFYNTNMPARRRENAKNGIFDASSWKPLPSGLLGPVSLSPVN